MLKKCVNALLLTNIDSFKETYQSLANDMGVTLRIEEDWNTRYRVSSDVIICGSKYLASINRQYYDTVVVVLKSTESPLPFVNQGVTRFVYDYNNSKELAMAFYKPEKVFVRQKDSVAVVLTGSLYLNFECAEYKFNFEKDKFFYKDKGLYFTEGEKSYLAQWLLNGHKDNSRRTCLFNLRKKFGKDFLKNIDRFGKIKEKKNEQ